MLGCPINLQNSREGSTMLAVSAGGGCVDIFSLAYQISSLSPSLWETTQYIQTKQEGHDGPGSLT